jgi:hypothetical protein
MSKDKDNEKKGGKLRKFFLFAMFAGAIASLMAFFRRRKGGMGDNEWQELPPPAGG